MMSELAIATLRGIIRKSSPGIRISDSAALELARVLEEEGSQIARRALELASHRGAKTVKAIDVRAATKEK